MPAAAIDHRHAVELAEEAGRLLVELRSGIGPDGLTPERARDEGDRRSHRLLMARLGQLHPDDAVLSEEGDDDHPRMEADRVWIVDPLDGTREFGEPPRTDWAVHVALSVGGQAVVGAVALPALGVVLGTSHEIVAAPPTDGPVRVAVSRTRAPHGALRLLVDELGATVVAMGSAGAKTAAVVLGKADVYFHAGGQYEWDSAAPVAVATRAGLHVSRADGSPLRYNQAHPWLPDLVVCRPELAERVLSAVSRPW